MFEVHNAERNLDGFTYYYNVPFRNLDLTQVHNKC